MTQPDIVTQTGYFLWNNGWSILLVVIVLSMIMAYIAVNDITFKKQKVKLQKVIVLEKYANPPPTTEQLNTEVENSSNNNSTCKQLGDKTSCTALGSCVWVKAQDKKNTIQKCVAAQALGTGSNAAKGSDGPSDMCYCSKDGKLIPWEEYYYLDGSTIKKKDAKPCTAKGDKCTYKN